MKCQVHSASGYTARLKAAAHSRNPEQEKSIVGLGTGIKRVGSSTETTGFSIPAVLLMGLLDMPQVPCALGSMGNGLWNIPLLQIFSEAEIKNIVVPSSYGYPLFCQLLC